MKYSYQEYINLNEIAEKESYLRDVGFRLVPNQLLCNNYVIILFI